MVTKKPKGLGRGLEALLGPKVEDAPTALRRVVPPLVAMLQRFTQHGFAPLRLAYAARDALAGRAVQLSDGTQGVAQGLDDSGALLVHTSAGLARISSAEVSVRPTS